MLHAQAQLTEKGAQWQIERTQVGLEAQTMQNKLAMAAAHESQLRPAGQQQDTQLADLQGRLAAAELEKVELTRTFRKGT